MPTAPPGAARTFDRGDALRRLAGQPFDVLVVGGGVTGAGVALDAAARGLRTALVERADFASGTSSRSSKMVHGGLRYLQQGDIRLVYEALHERQRLLRNAPHLVEPLPFLIPLFGRDGVVSTGVARAYATALWLYDLTGGWRIGHRHRRIDRAEALRHLPTLRTDRLVAGFLYFDARVDDARLTLALARTAACDFGAAVANYVEVVDLCHGPAGAVTGARVRLRGPGESAELDVRATVVVNATGVWGDEIRAMDEGAHTQMTRPAKGVHITVPADRLPADIAAVVPVPHDRRSVFVVPWADGDDTYVGTTDTAWDGDLDRPECTAEDADYLLAAVNAATTSSLGRADVTGVWAGLRPLLDPRASAGTPPHGSGLDGHAQGSAGTGGATGTGVPGWWDRLRRRRRAAASERTADLSRRHQVMTSPAGVVTVTGGKLTTYRLMAEETVDAVVRRLASAAPPGALRCPTRRLALRGAPGTISAEPTLRERHTTEPGVASDTAARGSTRHHAPSPGMVDDATRAYLFARHGTETDAVLAMAAGHPDLLQPLVPGLPYLQVEVVWAACHEMALTVDDVLSRRTRAALRRGHAAAGAAATVADLLQRAGTDGRQPGDLQAEAAACAAAMVDQLRRAGVPDPATAAP